MKFAESCKYQLDGLLRNGTFVEVQKIYIVGEERIFGSSFVDELKKVGEHIRRKIRLVAHIYPDEGAATIEKNSPTAQRLSQFFALFITTWTPGMMTYTLDVTQEYIQSHTPLERDPYIPAPSEMRLEAERVLCVVKLLNIIPESGLHRYLTYLAHYLEVLQMDRNQEDPCVLIRRDMGEMDGLVLLKVYDSLGIGTQTFWANKEEASIVFRRNHWILISTTLTSLNDLIIAHKEEVLDNTQAYRIRRFTTVTTEKSFEI